MRRGLYAGIAVGAAVALALALALWRWIPEKANPATAKVQSEDGSATDLRRFKPTAIQLTPPEIPEAMRLSHEAAEITAKVLIRPDGTVSSVSIIVSDIPAANDLVVAACKDWRFEPAGIEQEMMYHTRVPPRSGES